MKVTYLVQSAHKLGGTERSAITQANALAAAGHEARILSVVKAAAEPVFDIDPRVVVEHLVDLTSTYDETLQASESVLVPPRWDKQFSELTDIALERGLTGLQTDVLVTVTPALLACAVQLAFAQFLTADVGAAIGWGTATVALCVAVVAVIRWSTGRRVRSPWLLAGLGPPLLLELWLAWPLLTG